MTVRLGVVMVMGGLAALLFAQRFERAHRPAPAAATRAGASPWMGGPHGAGRPAPPHFGPPPSQPAADRAADREWRQQHLGRWLRGDAPARERALEGFVREAGLDSRSAARLRQLARGAGQTARTVDRLGDRTRMPAAALVDDTEALLRWILSEKQWALFCQRVLDQQT